MARGVKEDRELRKVQKMETMSLFVEHERRLLEFIKIGFAVHNVPFHSENYRVREELQKDLETKQVLARISGEELKLRVKPRFVCTHGNKRALAPDQDDPPMLQLLSDGAKKGAGWSSWSGRSAHAWCPECGSVLLSMKDGERWIAPGSEEAFE